MTSQWFNELRKMRHELAHSTNPVDPGNIARRFAELGIPVTANDSSQLIPAILHGLDWNGSIHRTPASLAAFLPGLLEGRTLRVVCDPWAGLGELLSGVCEIAKPATSLALTQSNAEYKLGRILLRKAEWHLGDPLELLLSSKQALDAAVSILPFGIKTDSRLFLRGTDGRTVELRDDLGPLILAATVARLEEDGVGLFVLQSSFFSQRSILRQFPALGFGVEAAFILPSGSFAPYTNRSTSLVVVRKHPISSMFVGQISADSNANVQLLKNFREGKEGASLELGRIVDPYSFVGLKAIRTSERLSHAERQFGSPVVRLEGLARAITLGRFGDDFKFPKVHNAVFIPLIGTSDVVESLEDSKLKQHNYSQVAVDPERSNARFVARFLNSDFGKELREMQMSGEVIPKMNKQGLSALQLFLPDLQTQHSLLEIETQIAVEETLLLGLQNELGESRRELWANPRSASGVTDSLAVLSNRLSGSLQQHAAESLEQWFESLPFPLASILRAWQATPSQDFKTKHEHLLHFFEGTAQFISVILLSAFSSNEPVFEEHKRKMAELMQKQNLSFQRATFGTWKFVVEYLGKQTRQLLAGDEDSRTLCAEMFSDPSWALPEALSRKDLATTLGITNKMRNDWGGHGGVVGQEDAQLRNEQLLGEVQRLRDAIAETWSNTQLIRGLHCRPRRGLFENEIAVLMGSNSEFLKEARLMLSWLDVDSLYLASSDSKVALKLLPLVQVGPSPKSAKNACHFFNRLERDGASRFVSYHFVDTPELTEQSLEATEAIKLLTEP